MGLHKDSCNNGHSLSSYCDVTVKLSVEIALSAEFAANCAYKTRHEEDYPPKNCAYNKRETLHTLQCTSLRLRRRLRLGFLLQCSSIWADGRFCRNLCATPCASCGTTPGDDAPQGDGLCTQAVFCGQWLSQRMGAMLSTRGTKAVVAGGHARVMCHLEPHAIVR